MQEVGLVACGEVLCVITYWNYLFFKLKKQTIINGKRARGDVFYGASSQSGLLREGQYVARAGCGNPVA